MPRKLCSCGGSEAPGRILLSPRFPLQSCSTSETPPGCLSLSWNPGSDSMPSMDINEWRSSLIDSCLDGCAMIVCDGTWKHAKEMASGGSIYDSELILRKEPFRGCMSTMEAVARALRVLEPDGVEIEDKLVDVLKTMVHLRACYLKPMKPRPSLSRTMACWTY